MRRKSAHTGCRAQSHNCSELDGPCVGIGAARIDLEGAASEGAASMPAPPGVAVGIGGADAADDSGVGGAPKKKL